MDAPIFLAEKKPAGQSQVLQITSWERNGGTKVKFLKMNISILLYVIIEGNFSIFPFFLDSYFPLILFYSERASEGPFGKCPKLTPRAFFMWKSKLQQNVFQTIPAKRNASMSKTFTVIKKTRILKTNCGWTKFIISNNC